VFERGPDARWPRECRRWRLQFNLSETTFILPSERAQRPGEDLSRPATRCPFAGHPTLGHGARVPRASDWREIGSPWRCPQGSSRCVPAVTAGPCRPKTPSWREVQEPRPGTGGKCWELDEHDIGERPAMGERGHGAAHRAADERGRGAAVCGCAPIWLAQLPSVDGRSMGVCICPPPAPDSWRAFFSSRMAVRRWRIRRPGRRPANLGGWCLAMARALPCEFDISQGEYIGRPSALRLRVDA